MPDARVANPAPSLALRNDGAGGEDDAVAAVAAIRGERNRDQSLDVITMTGHSPADAAVSRSRESSTYARGGVETLPAGSCAG